MKIWIFEDQSSTVGVLQDSLQKHLPHTVFEILRTVESGDRAIELISDDDLVTVDSQVPSEATGRPAYKAGEQFVAKIRAKGLTCRILWHSDIHLDSLPSLGVEYTDAADIGVMASADETRPERIASREKWRVSGEALLGRLLDNQVPLIELAPLSILCQGYLAIVGAAGLFPNEIVDQLKKTAVGQEWLNKASTQLDQALNAGEWFAPGRESISAAIKSKGIGDAVYWNSINDTDLDSEAIRRLYDNVSGQSTQITGEQLHQLVADAHRSLQCLFERRYL